MPHPQSLVTFLATLFVLLLATRGQLGLAPVPAALVSIAFALGLAWMVDRRIPEEEDAEGDVTDEASSPGDADAKTNY